MDNVVVVSDSKALVNEAAERWVQIAAGAVETQGRFSLALSGGSTPQPLYELMATEPWRERVPWTDTFVFWGDERRVPPTDPDSNYRMAWDALLSKVPIPQEQIFRMEGQGLSRTAARDYENILRRHFDLGRGDWPRFDLILLGMGSDGHIASIFPGTRAVSNLSAMIVAYEVPQLKKERMTLTLPVINNTRNVVFMIAGESKADTLYQTLHGDHRPSTYPGQAVKPTDGTLTYIVDQAAASKLADD